MDLPDDLMPAESIKENDFPPVDEVMLNAFAEYILNRKLEKKIEDEYVRVHLDALISVADEFGWIEVVTALRELGNELDFSIRQGLMTKLKPFIKSALNRELVLHFYGQKALIKHDLLDDNQFSRAIEILEDSRKYKNILVKKQSD